MKRYSLLLTAICVIISTTVYSQTPTRTGVPVSSGGSSTGSTTEGSHYVPRSFKLYFGAFANASLGLNTNPGDGYKTGVAVGFPDYGFCFFQPFNKTGSMGFGLNIGWTSVNYQRKTLGGKDDKEIISTIDEKYSYTSLYPHFYFGGFVLGCQYGMSPTTIGGRPDGLTNAIIPKIGVSIPAYDDEYGRFQIDFQVGYVVNSLYEKAENYGYYKNTENVEEYNPRPIVVSIGFTVMGITPIYY